MLKVKEIRPTVVTVPFTDPETWFFGRTWGLTNIVIEIETEDGLVGIGELPGLPTANAALLAVDAMAKLLVGTTATDIVPFLRRTQQFGWHHFPYQGNVVVAGLEMALWDIVGKASGLPLHALLGGRQSETVPYYWYVWVTGRDAASAREQAAQGVALGFETVYLKIGFDLTNDLTLVRAVRDEVGPDIAIRVDANEAWTPLVARRALAAFDDCDLEFLEQPTDMHDIAAMADLRQRSRTPIGANQSAWQPHQVPALLAAQAADVIVTDPHQLGGLSVFRDIAAMCEIAHVPLVKHSFGDLGITTAASMHVLANLPVPSLGHQQHLTILEHDLLTEPLEFVDGCLAVPDRPGIGVDLDCNALEHYAELYHAVGEMPAYANVDAPDEHPGRQAASYRQDAGAMAARTRGCDQQCRFVTGVAVRGGRSFADRISTLSEVRKLGHITPSCNTALEPLTAMMISEVTHLVSNHFARIAVETISLEARDTERFEIDSMLGAARSLSDANMDAIVWNGTSGCWNGVAADVDICHAIAEETGVSASTSTLAQIDAFKLFGIDRYALAVPYQDDVTQRTVDTYAEAGFTCVGRANLRISSGSAMANVPFDDIRALIRAADTPEAPCVVIICTGLPAALLVEELEDELGKPIFDSIAVTQWKALQLAGVQTQIDGWGMLLRGDEQVRALLASDELQSAVDELRAATGASRVTLRSDAPGDYAFPVTHESLEAGVGSLTGFRELPQAPSPTFDRIARDRSTIVMDDCEWAASGGDPEYSTDYFRELMGYYRMGAFIAAPVFDGKRLIANISVHQVDAARRWSENDVAAAELAVGRVRGILTGQVA